MLFIHADLIRAGGRESGCRGRRARISGAHFPKILLTHAPERSRQAAIDDGLAVETPRGGDIEGDDAVPGGGGAGEPRPEVPVGTHEQQFIAAGTAPARRGQGLGDAVVQFAHVGRNNEAAAVGGSGGFDVIEGAGFAAPDPRQLPDHADDHIIEEQVPPA